MLLLLRCTVLLAEWRERGSCITACLHLNPSMALTTALANLFRLREAAMLATTVATRRTGGEGPAKGCLEVVACPPRRAALSADDLCPTGRWRMREAP